ncbi:MAG: LuxR family transcriptional regulator [Frankiales bacterium]|jgi:CheY-like chemotaxis protein|nr:LuxR family transcriptional regulator [Frankiales bacterium]
MNGQEPITILVVDDAPDMRMLAKHYLESAGYQVVEEAVDGDDAVNKFVALDPPPVPTVILLDNMMPKLTGMEAAAQILAHAPDQLIVMFTAYLDDSIQEKAKRLGVAACVSKTDLADLPGIIGDMVSARG